MDTTNLKELPINVQLELFTQYGFDIEEITAQESSMLKIAHCNGIIQSLFRVIHYVADEEQFQKHGLEKELAHLAELGIAVAQASAQEIELLDDRLSDAGYKEVGDEREN